MLYSTCIITCCNICLLFKGFWEPVCNSCFHMKRKLLKVTIFVIFDIVNIQYVQCGDSSYIWASVEDDSSTFAAFCRSRLLKDCLTWCVFPQGGLRHYTSERAHFEGQHWSDPLTHTHTSMKTQEQWQSCVPQRFLSPRVSFYRDDTRTMYLIKTANCAQRKLNVG